ncbi:uncharacterized protein LOC117517959 [Thalassophryne amazonica]|uniref:uncharacterized protein LOC117517959 n=1 Tax=Thalassophryne amazonica TaxID=390379 RepID=UPI0014713DDD|nr:uncharacterized protein LOC117517959 [Thalassophryne amazonica]
MSIPTNFQGLKINIDTRVKMTNKTQIQVSLSGDDNANRMSSMSDQEESGLERDTVYTSSSIPLLDSQSEASQKVLIWASEQQCMDSGLRDFELLESQDIHMLLGNRNQDEETEDDDDGASTRDGKDEGPMSISSSSTASSASTGGKRNDNDSNKVESRMHRSKDVQKNTCYSTEELDACVTGAKHTRSGTVGDKDRRKGGLKETKSETNVFVSSLSAISLSGSLSSALDCTGQAQSLMSLSNSKVSPYPNVNLTTSAQTRKRAPPAEAIRNKSPLDLQEKHDLEERSQYHCQDQRQDGNHPRNGLSSEGGLGQRRKAGFEERVLPPRRQQLVRPLCQTEMGRGRSLIELIPSVQQSDTGQVLPPTPLKTHTVMRQIECLQNHLYVNHQIFLTCTTHLERHSPDSQTRLPRKMPHQWKSNELLSSSPPHSPLRTPQGSPRRHPSMFLPSRSVSGVVRHTQSGYNPVLQMSAQGYGNSCLRALVKTNISTTGIPKAPLNSQQSSPSSNHNSSPKESSPSPKHAPKPKGVRPKIITYVRKNPLFKPQVVDGSYQVSSLPSKLPAYSPSSLKETTKDPLKPEVETRGAPVISASNLLYDKYRQEMQANIFPSGMISRSIRPPGHTNTIPPAHTHSHPGTLKLGGKADNFCATPSEVTRTYFIVKVGMEDLPVLKAVPLMTSCSPEQQTMLEGVAVCCGLEGVYVLAWEPLPGQPLAQPRFEGLVKVSPYPNVNLTTSAQTRKRAPPAEAIRNKSPLDLQEKHDLEERSQYHCQDQRQDGNHPRNGLSSEGGLGQRRKAGFEERVLPPRRQQLVRPLCQTEMGRGRSLIELIPSVQQSDTGQSSSSNSSQDSHSYETNRMFTKSSLREPSDFSHLYNTSGASQPRQPNQASKKMPHQWKSNELLYHECLWSCQAHTVRIQPCLQMSAQGYGNSCLRALVKTNISTTGIPKAPLNSQQSSPSSNHNSSPKESSPSPKHAPKPKGVRPKIITYVRKNPLFKPQVVDGSYQVSSLPSKLPAYSPSSLKETTKDPLKPEVETRGAPVISASNLLYDKYRQEMQANIFPSGMISRSIRPPGHTNTIPPAHTHSHPGTLKLGGKADNFCATPSENGRSTSFKGGSSDDQLQPRTADHAGGSGSLLRSGRGLRLGLGAVTRTTTGSAKIRGSGQGQKSTLVFSQPVQPVSPAMGQSSRENTAEDQVFTHPAAAPVTSQPQAPASRPLLPKGSQSGLRPPGFSTNRLPPARLAAFGFVRSSSVSSASSTQSADGPQTEYSRTAHRLSVSEDPPLHRVTNSPASTSHQHVAPGRCNSLQPPSTPALPRRYLPPQPRNSPGVGRKEFQRSSEVTRSLPSSPKRLAVVPPKPQSPVQSGQRPPTAVLGSVSPSSPHRVALLRPQQESLQQEKEEAQQKEKEREAEEKEKEEQRQEVQRLQGRCEQQERQLRAVKRELRKTSLGLEAFIITTQHYCLKNKTSEENERKLSVEMQKIREELACKTARWERLQREKTTLEVAFERELQELQVQQEAELAAVEEGLRKCHSAEAEQLKAEYRSEMEELRTQQQEQMEELTANHQAAVQELRDMHNITLATLHEEHARTMRDLRKAHEQQKMLLEEDFEKLRLCLQDQVDTLTFQNQTLRDKAKRFEEALRRSTDEQIVDALAPYQYIEQDLKSLKEVVEMKNQQMHQQEKKISDLEKVQAQKNVFLEEKIQVLQQQNEDLKARIEMNQAMSRQLSEENANLQESVEKENTEKKRLSRNNEELLWRLQTSPLMSPSSSPLHRSFSSSPVASPLLFSSSPVAVCDSPTHCHGCPQQTNPTQYSSPSHRGTTNQNLSPGPATPTRRAASNQNYSPGPATPAHRACLGSSER